MNKLFKSKALDTDDAYSFTFATPGTYDYFCSLHPHMTGTIVVEAQTGSNAADVGSDAAMAFGRIVDTRARDRARDHAS